MKQLAPFTTKGYMLQSPLQIEAKNLFQSRPTTKRNGSYIRIRQTANSTLSPRKTLPDDSLLKQLKECRVDIAKLQSEKTRLQSDVLQLTQENTSLLKELEQMRSRIQDQEISLRVLREDNRNDFVKRSTSFKTDNVLKQHISYLENKIQTLSQPVLDLGILEKTKERQKELETLCVQMKRMTECRLCYKPLKDAVTVIPCAHSYCRGCKKGYQSKCHACEGYQQIEAVYQNKFMTSLIELYEYAQFILRS